MRETAEILADPSALRGLAEARESEQSPTTFAPGSARSPGHLVEPGPYAILQPQL